MSAMDRMTRGLGTAGPVSRFVGGTLAALVWSGLATFLRLARLGPIAVVGYVAHRLSGAGDSNESAT